MAKIKVQAQHLKPGDIVGSNEKVVRTFWPTIMDKTLRGKIGVQLTKDNEIKSRVAYWGKYTVIGAERAE